ncbi:hypothetical protein ACFFRR_001046 [Megaselia abdita]
MKARPLRAKVEVKLHQEIDDEIDHIINQDNEEIPQGIDEEINQGIDEDAMPGNDSVDQRQNMKNKSCIFKMALLSGAQDYSNYISPSLFLSLFSSHTHRNEALSRFDINVQCV